MFLNLRTESYKANSHFTFQRSSYPFVHPQHSNPEQAAVW